MLNSHSSLLNFQTLAVLPLSALVPGHINSESNVKRNCIFQNVQMRSAPSQQLSLDQGGQQAQIVK